MDTIAILNLKGKCIYHNNMFDFLFQKTTPILYFV